jgi:putative transposase
MIRYIDAHRGAYGVEPICRVLEVAPSSYYAARSRPPSARAERDAQLAELVVDAHRSNFGVYGVRKLWRTLLRDGVSVGRDQVGRLMHTLDLTGATRRKRIRTTRPAARAAHPDDLVGRVFRAPAPNRLWVADLTYVPLADGGFGYTAFIIDAFSRRIVGWRVATTLAASLALGALEVALWARRGESLGGLVHHSDRGVQYLSIRYTRRLAEVGAVGSVGSRGDSYDNALAETVHGLYKGELINRHLPWHSVAAVERATGDWVTWWNERRLHSACGDVPPAEFEATYWRHLNATTTAA